MKELFSLAGISHILVVSGLHVGFLVGMIFGLLRLLKLKRIPSTIITFIILLLYNIVCGFSPSVVRASIMAIVLMLSKVFGGEYDGLNSLGLAGFITLLIQPLFVFDYGFLMSYGCVAAIYLLCPTLTKLFRKFLPRKAGDLIAVSISASLGFLPFLAMFASKVNLLSPFINLLIVPIFSIFFPISFASC